MVKFIASCLLFCAVSTAAIALEIKEVMTTKGIASWLVESHQLPMVTVQVAFRSGSAFDPEGKEGLAAFTAGLFTEGAGSLGGTAFQEKLDMLGSRLSVTTNRLDTTFTLTTLSQNVDESFDLLVMAITDPRFEREAMERLRRTTLSAIKQIPQNPASVVSHEFPPLVYGEKHPYAHPTEGVIETVSAFTRKDVKDFYKENYTKTNMVVSVVGDITPRKLKTLLEGKLVNLTYGTGCNKLEKGLQAPTPLIKRIEMPVPQSHVLMGHKGINRHDEDYFAAYAMNYMLGGGGFNSRLMEEIREKRGLTYGVYSYFDFMPDWGPFMVAVQTKNKDAGTSIALIKKEMQRIKDKGVRQKEYEGAMSYLTGSFPLRLDSNRKILGYLTVMQREELGKDYLDKWVERVKQVTRDDIQRVAKRLLHPEDMVVLIVGGPAEE